jgi:hypothetical protein
MNRFFSIVIYCVILPLAGYGFVNKTVYFVPIDSKKIFVQPFNNFCLYASYDAFSYNKGITVRQSYCYGEDSSMIDTLTKIVSYKYRLSFSNEDTLMLKNIDVSYYRFTHNNLSKMIKKNKFLYLEVFIITDSLGVRKELYNKVKLKKKVYYEFQPKLH